MGPAPPVGLSALHLSRRRRFRCFRRRRYHFHSHFHSHFHCQRLSGLVAWPDMGRSGWLLCGVCFAYSTMATSNDVTPARQPVNRRRWLAGWPAGASALQAAAAANRRQFTSRPHFLSTPFALGPPLMASILSGGTRSGRRQAGWRGRLLAGSPAAGRIPAWRDVRGYRLMICSPRARPLSAGARQVASCARDARCRLGSPRRDPSYRRRGPDFSGPQDGFNMAARRWSCGALGAAARGPLVPPAWLDGLLTVMPPMNGVGSVAWRAISNNNNNNN